jgi:hypothetical protein
MRSEPADLLPIAIKRRLHPAGVHQRTLDQLIAIRNAGHASYDNQTSGDVTEMGLNPLLELRVWNTVDTLGWNQVAFGARGPAAMEIPHLPTL